MIGWKIGVVLFLFFSICGPLWVNTWYNKRRKPILDEKARILNEYHEITRSWEWCEVEQHVLKQMPERDAKNFLKAIKSYRETKGVWY